MNIKEARKIVFKCGYTEEDIEALNEERIIDLAETRLRIKKLL